ncbi:hypothetical protein [Aeromonas diversa]|uniref:hypothetical protein n=1 Tax=Aeromonas diversa TaxID=502790 RepID=UPI00346275B9
MIVFTADSTRHIIKLLDTGYGSPVDFLFFNDGTLIRKVIEITRVSEDFDVNGMTMAVPLGYHLRLEDGNTLGLSLGNSEMLHVATTPQSQDEPGSLKSWIEAGVQHYHF